jgi:hypothetical protein
LVGSWSRLATLGRQTSIDEQTPADGTCCRERHWGMTAVKAIDHSDRPQVDGRSTGSLRDVAG